MSNMQPYSRIMPVDGQTRYNLEHNPSWEKLFRNDFKICQIDELSGDEIVKIDHNKTTLQDFKILKQISVHNSPKMIFLGAVHNVETNRFSINCKGRIMNNAYVVLLKNMGYILWKNLRKHPLSMVKIGKLGFSLKSSIQAAASDDKKVRIESTMEIIESVLEFRQSNPKEFEIILNALDAFVQEYKNPETNEAIMKILFKETEMSDEP